MMRILNLQKLLLTICLLMGGFAYAQNVGINEDGGDPDASAILDLNSTAKGFLVPRMTTGEREAISSPAEGLITYDTNYQSLWYFDGATWQMMDMTVSGSGVDDVPANPYVGQLYFDTSEDKLFIYVSGGWSEIGLGAAIGDPYGATGTTNPTTIIDFFNENSLLSSMEKSCELEGGTMTTCCQLTFQSHRKAWASSDRFDILIGKYA